MGLKLQLASFVNNASLKIAIWQKSIPKLETTRLGTNYGGYFMPTDLLFSQKEKVLISGGLGFDISFDLALIEAGFTVIGVEPIAESIQYVEETISTLGILNRYELVPRAISDHTGHEEFRAPLESKNYHWWANQNSSSDNFKTATFPCISIKEVSEIAQSRGNLIVCKFDIEGHEIRVIESVLKNDIKFDWLMIEMDYLNLVRTHQFPKKFYRAIKVRFLMVKMNRAGYLFVLNEGFNFFWSGSKQI